MFKYLFLTFLIIPIIEIYLLIKVGSVIGALPTIFIVIGTAVLGAFLLRQQGLSTLARIQHTLARGELPAVELIEGMILLVAGALLLTPGFFTDTLGFIGLIPMFRAWFVRWLLRHMNIFSTGPQPNRRPPPGNVIDGDYRRED